MDPMNLSVRTPLGSQRREAGTDARPKHETELDESAVDKESRVRVRVRVTVMVMVRVRG